MSQKSNIPREQAEQLRKVLLRARPDNYGAIKCQEPGLFWVRITPAMTERTLALVALVMGGALERGHSFAGKPSGGFVVDDVHLSVGFNEKIRQVAHVPTKEEKSRPWYELLPPRRFDYVGSGVLEVQISAIGGRKVFTDKKDAKLEQLIPEILEAFVNLSAGSKIELERIAKRNEDRRLAEEHRASMLRERERKEKELADLESETTSWSRARAIRDYAEAVERAAEMQECSRAIAGWLNVARGYADSLDPLSRRLILLKEAEIKAGSEPPLPA